MRIGFTSYINSIPFHTGLKDYLPYSQILRHVPSMLNNMVINKQLDISLVSSVHYLKYKNRLKLVDPFCISASKTVDSVFLFYKDNLFKKSHPHIFLTSQSATSVALLKVLCEFYWNIKPTFTYEPKDKVDASLIIGDDALETAKKDLDRIDLAHAWFEFTQLPIVFALCVAQSELPEELIFSFQTKQKQNLDNNIHSLSHCIDGVKDEYSITDISKTARYLQQLEYTLNEDHYQSLETFKNYLEKASFL